MNIPGLEKSKLERAEEQLYDPKTVPQGVVVHDMHQARAEQLPTSWGDDNPMLVKAQPEKSISFGLKLLLFSLLLLLAVGGYASYRLLASKNAVSSEHIDIVSDMKPYVEGGEQIPLAVSINNRNAIPLEEAKLTIMYEKGIGSSDEQQKVSEKRTIGTISPNELQKQQYSIVLYGEESSSRDVTIKLEYKVPGSNALFTKVVTTTTVLKTPPVGLRIEGPDTLASGQLGTYTVTIRNNTSTSSVPFRLAFDAPINFVKDSTNPEVPKGKDTGWDITTLAPGESKTFEVKGSFTGSVNQASTIRVLAGSSKDGSEVSVIYSSDKKEVTIRSTPIAVAIRTETDRGTSDSLRFGDRATMYVSYNNKSNDTVRNLEIKATVLGDGADYQNIVADEGYYDSEAKTILWSKATDPGLESIAPNQTKEFRLSVPVIVKGSSNPSITVNVEAKGDDQGVGDVQTNIQKRYAIQGSASLNAWTSYRESPFANQGPVPPVANKTTTYTVHVVASAQNTLGGTKVSFILPIYVTWNNVFTEGKKISYVSGTRTVVWDIGQINAGGTEVADIQLAVKPSQSHVGSSPTITSGITLEGQEVDSRSRIRTTLTPLTTELPREVWGGDPARVIAP
jgi:hypothetical protein